jgi:hypothetical protein
LQAQSPEFKPQFHKKKKREKEREKEGGKERKEKKEREENEKPWTGRKYLQMTHLIKDVAQNIQRLPKAQH